jgi:hypothetical protein
MVRRLSHDLNISKRRAALYQLALINAIGAIGGVQAGVIVYRWRGLYVAEAEAKSHT